METPANLVQNVACRPLSIARNIAYIAYIAFIAFIAWVFPVALAPISTLTPGHRSKVASSKTVKFLKRTAPSVTVPAKIPQVAEPRR